MDAAERLREALNHRGNTEILEARAHEALAEIERLRGNNATLDAVVASIADELGCAADNEAILAAIERLRDGQAGG